MPCGPVRHRAWDCRVRHHTNQQIQLNEAANKPATKSPTNHNKPTNQQTNKPTNQQTNKPTEQQSNRATTNIPAKQQTTQQQSDPKIVKKSSKNHPKSTKKLSKIHQNGSKIGPGGSLGGVLGPSWPQEATRAPKVRSTPFVAPSWAPTWTSKSTKNR